MKYFLLSIILILGLSAGNYKPVFAYSTNYTIVGTKCINGFKYVLVNFRGKDGTQAFKLLSPSSGRQVICPIKVNK